MAKGSRRGGTKKKGKKKKKKEKKVDPNALTEVDRTFYELTITDLNRKLARLRSLTTELEEKNEELKNELAKMDEDRSDVIIYLKRMLQEKSDEIAELQNRLKAMEETKQDETEKFEEKIRELEEEYQQMHDQLTSEIKLLEGKLNALEEFRIQRDELMKKFELQENMMEEQEIRHKNELYDIERRFIIEKDKLKKEMEAKLLQLSCEFQDATELRIAATTHRVIRENIAINNELDAMLSTHHRLHSENATMKERDTTLRQEASLHEEEKKIVLGKLRVQKAIIDRLTKEHKEMKEQLVVYKRLENERNNMAKMLGSCEKSGENLQYKVRVLEQNLHAHQCKEIALRTELEDLKTTNTRLYDVLEDAVVAINEALEIKTMQDKSLAASRRENLLTNLLLLLSEARTQKPPHPSLETVPSLSACYERGDLGFIPKSTRRGTIQMTRHIEIQTGPSFEEFLHQDESGSLHSVKTSEGSLDEEETTEKSMDEQSDVYFDDRQASSAESLLDEDQQGEQPEEEEKPCLEDDEFIKKLRELRQSLVDFDIRRSSMLVAGGEVMRDDEDADDADDADADSGGEGKEKQEEDEEDKEERDDDEATV